MVITNNPSLQRYLKAAGLELREVELDPREVARQEAIFRRQNPEASEEEVEARVAYRIITMQHRKKAAPPEATAAEPIDLQPLLRVVGRAAWSLLVPLWIIVLLLVLMVVSAHAQVDCVQVQEAGTVKKQWCGGIAKFNFAGTVACSGGACTVSPIPSEYDNGTCTTAKTISAANGSRQKVLLTNAQTCALTFTQPTAGTASIQLKITQSSAGSYNGAISGGKWPGATVPTITATAGAVDFISCYLDGTNAYCVATQDMR